jgi:predicted amidophosphoribosyltransferase
MSETKGCLGWIAATIGWFFLWGLCISIGDTYKISPFAVLIIMVIGTLVLAGTGIYIYTSAHTKIYNKHVDRVNYIANKYGLAYRKFVDTNKIKKDIMSGKITELSELKKISSREDSLWEKEENILREEKEKRDRENKIKWEEWKKNAERIKKEYPDGYEEWAKTEPKKWLYSVVTEPAICDAEEKIKALDKHIVSERWEKAQSDFTSRCYNIAKTFLPNYGRYTYNIPFTKYDTEGKEIPGTYKVWQFFCNAMCLEDLDYTYFSTYKEMASTIPGLKNKSRYYKPSVYIEIAKFIKEIAEYYCKDQDDTITVLFNYEKDWDKDVLRFHYKSLLAILSSEEYNSRVSCDDTIILDDYDEKDADNRLLLTDDVIVIIDITTDNNELRNLCKKIITYDKKSHPVITYISLLKAFDKDEMTSLIDKEDKRQAQIKEEKEKEEKGIKNLLEAVSSWDTLVGGLHFSYLFYYYPTTCDFEATEEEWANRWIVWDFKNTPGKTSVSDHQKALDKAIPMLKDKLLTTFEADSLKYLTLVCIPASSQLKTHARYEEFSNRICGELGLLNAFPHISVVSEKEERRAGGTSIDTNKLSFDEEFFKGKYVLLFDDVITRGDSMRTFKRKMESLGAIVVGGLSLGKTKHERPTQGNIPNPFSHPVFPPQPMATSDDNDLPF